mmetsp:Transcript_7912/g.28081  ORF Transcript_7912/g.28081 Transcript_7912/m.28081 type:complete len:226 (-) Transcript_7912:417-1094(-)
MRSPNRRSTFSLVSPTVSACHAPSYRMMVLSALTAWSCNAREMAGSVTTSASPCTTRKGSVTSPSRASHAVDSASSCEPVARRCLPSYTMGLPSFARARTTGSLKALSMRSSPLGTACSVGRCRASHSSGGITHGAGFISSAIFTIGATSSAPAYVPSGSCSAVVSAMAPPRLSPYRNAGTPGCRARTSPKYARISPTTSPAKSSTSPWRPSLVPWPSYVCAATT